MLEKNQIKALKDREKHVQLPHAIVHPAAQNKSTYHTH